MNYPSRECVGTYAGELLTTRANCSNTFEGVYIETTPSFLTAESRGK